MADGDSGRRVYIHAGAHRTGSSSFQLCLHENRQVLAEQGYDVAYPSRDGVPGGELALRLPSVRHGADAQADFVRKVKRNLKQAVPKARADLILSDENIAGPMVHFNKGQFYPACRQRLRVLAEALPGPVAHLVYVVRSYERLYISAHRKRAEKNLVAPFETYWPFYGTMDRGWPEMVVLMRDVLKPARLSIVPYETITSTTALVAQLVPNVQEARINAASEVLNRSATDRALRVLQRRLTTQGKLRRADREAIINQHSGDTKDRGFARFPTQVTKKLQRRYARDLERLAIMRGVDLIQPNSARLLSRHPKARPFPQDHFGTGFFPSTLIAPQPLRTAG